MDGRALEAKIKTTIEQVKAAQGRSRFHQLVTLVAVSKRQPVEIIKAAANLGVKDFGENYLQEAQQKMQELKGLKLSWHFIGELQRKKLKALAGRFGLIHSLNSFYIASHLNRRCEEAGLRQRVLWQVNAASESGKQGLCFEQAYCELEKSAYLPALEICGLMVFPPPAEDAEASRPYFKAAREYCDRWSKTLRDQGWRGRLTELSMGTSQDFEVAIEEGATLVRVGQSMLGKRPVKEGL